MSVFHISYATEQFRQASSMLLASAKKFGVKQTKIYNSQNHILSDLKMRFPEIMSQSRGAGYWLWKPYIILDTLNQAKDDDIVLYTDVAMTFVADPLPLINLANDFPVVLFKMTPTRFQSHWTKRDCFIILDADSPEYWNTPQLWAGCQLYRVCAEARRFVSDLCEAMSDTRALTDIQNVLGEPNLPGFCEHRHDQSILTIQAKRLGGPLFPDPSQYGPWGDHDMQSGIDDGIPVPTTPYRKTFFLHRTRDFCLLKHTLFRATKFYTGRKFFI